MGVRTGLVVVTLVCHWCAEAAAVGPPRGRLDRYGDPLPAGAIARLGTARLYHWLADTDCLALSSDGKRLVTAGGGVVKVWEVNTGKELARHEVPGDGRHSLAASLGRTGKTLTVVAGHRMLWRWDIASGKVLVHRRLGHDEEPAILTNLCAFSADGLRVAIVSGKDKRYVTEVYETDTAKRVHVMPRTNGSWPPALSPDGKWLAVRWWKDGSSVWVVNLQTGAERELEGCPERNGLLAFTADGRALAASGTTNKTYLWELPSGKGRAMQGGGNLLCSALHFSLGGKELLVVGPDRTFWFDRATGKPKGVRAVGGGSPRAPAALSSDGLRLASREHGRAKVIDLASGRDVCPLPGHQGGINDLCFSADGKHLLSGGASPMVILWDIAAVREAHRWEERYKRANQVAFTHAGRTALVRNEDDLIAWSVASGKAVWRVNDAWFVAASAHVPLVATIRGHQLSLREPVTGQERKRVRLVSEPRGRMLRVRGLAMSRTGRQLLLSLDEESEDFPRDRLLRLCWLLDLHRPAESRPIGQDHEGNRKRSLLAWSPSGSQVLLVDDRGAALWDVQTSRLVRAMGSGREAETVVCAAISPDGKWVALTHANGDRVHLYEAATGARAQRFHSSDGVVTALAFAPDSRSLAGGTTAGSILLWGLLGADHPASVPLPRAEQARLWSDLASLDGATAFRAMRRGKALLPALARELRSLSPSVTQGGLARLITELDDETFAVREKAAATLEGLGPLAEPAIREALASGPSLEARKRLERLLRQVIRAKPTGDHLRILRAVAVLELVGSPQALRLLDGLARHSPDPTLRHEAAAARDRMVQLRAATGTR